MSADNLEALFEPLHFFFSVFQGILDVKDLVVDLIHVICEGADIGVKIEIGMAIFTSHSIVELL